MENQDNFSWSYAQAHSRVGAEEVLAALERRTHLEVLMPQMLSGHIQGQFFAFLSRMIKPKRVLEIGTFTGYSALCWAQGLAEGGKVITLEVNPELAHIAQEAWQAAGVAERIELKIGPAVELIPQLQETWDLVFIDADKLNYPNYYNLVFKQVRIGGYIVVDNVLWHGKVLDSQDKRAVAIHGLNEMIQNDSRVVNVMLPLRDGILLVEKVSD